MQTLIINNTEMDKYLAKFGPGQIIFLEGDDSQDLYILSSGQVDILKGNKNIAEINQKGALFGEMSFFLGDKRTATVKARNDVQAIRIPKEEISNFLREFPNVAEDITKLLAQRLNETSHALFGLKEFCDQLPEAVILTDREGKIFTWNSAAEKLYGRDSHEMRYSSVADFYEEPHVYKKFLREVQTQNCVCEKILRIKHPEKGTRFISASTTLLYDDQHNFQGVLSLCRDCTANQTLERKYRRTRYWLVPSLFVAGLLVVAVFFGYPYFSQGVQTLDTKKQELKSQLAKDFFLLKSLLVDYFLEMDRSKTTPLMKEFFRLQENTSTPYFGLVLLDKNKKVFDIFSIRSRRNGKEMVGSSYAGIVFDGNDDSLHRVLSLYRTDKRHPRGYKGIEVAFKIRKENQDLGWLVFQMDVEMLKEIYRTDARGLKRFQFKGS